MTKKKKNEMIELIEIFLDVDAYQIFDRHLVTTSENCQKTIMKRKNKKTNHNETKK